MDKTKVDFWKKFSLVLFLYLFLILNVWFVPEWDLKGKISWTFFLLMLLHFTYATLDLVVHIEMWLEGNRGYVIKRSKLDLTVMYEMKKAMRFMCKRIRLQLMESLRKKESDKTTIKLRKLGNVAAASFKRFNKVKEEVQR